MGKRGEELREHILYAAKDVFLEMGFERASMDVIAARADTSKRTLYAHFESKERLFLAVIELVRGLFSGKLRTPADYPGDPAEALTAFCGRFLESLLYAPTVRMCRMLMAETERFPEGAARLCDVLFCAPQERLAAYLRDAFGLSSEASSEAAQALLGRVIHPRLTRALFGVDAPFPHLDADALRADFDLAPVRKAVEELIASRKSNDAPAG